MQIDWVQAFFFPIVTGLTLLGVEYFGIQRLLRRQETEVPKLANGGTKEKQRKWSSAIKKAVEQFKEIPLPYNWKWYSIRQNFVSVSEFSADQFQAQLTIDVTARFLLSFITPKVVARYTVTIGRTGHIYQYKEVPLSDDALDSSRLPFPFSWIIIAIFLIGWTSLQLNKPPEGDAIVRGKLVSTLWSAPRPISVNSSENGVLGGNEIHTYILTSQSEEVVNIRVETVDYFSCYLSVYNTNNSLIRRGITYGGVVGMNLAPESMVSYLIVIYPESQAGGSYTLHVNTATTLTPAP